MFRKIIDYLNLRQAGGLELFFALLMILSAYSFMGIPLQVVLWSGLFALLLFKQNKRQIKHKRSNRIRCTVTDTICFYLSVYCKGQSECLHHADILLW